MARNKDEDIEEQEQEYEENQRMVKCEYAARLVVLEGWGRMAAMDKAAEIMETQREATQDVRGVIGTLEEAQSPARPNNDKQARQIKAVAQELFDQSM